MKLRAAFFAGRVRGLRRRPRRGIALVLCLWIVVLVAIIAVGVSNLMRMERTASASYFDRMQASEFARMGPDSVAGAILKTSAATNYTWVTTPGQLYTGTLPIAPGSKSSPGLLVPLSSGTAPSATPSPAVLVPPNLNVSLFSDTNRHIITEEHGQAGGPLDMRVKWIYLRKDGSRDTNDIPVLTDKANPIVGRYAYWADDESSRINVNLAWTRDAANTSRTGSPTRVSLAAIPDMTNSLADQIHQAVTTDGYLSSPRFYNSPEDISRLSTNAAAVLLDNRFDVTHFNHDPDTTFFNEPRIVLTTKFATANPGLAKGDPKAKPYLEILTDETKDPGDYTNIDSTKMTATIQKLKSYLERTDWPFLPGASFQQKYYSGYPAASQSPRLTQLAINIIDYVRSRESSQSIVPPSRGALQADGSFLFGAAASGATSGDAFSGLTRAPYITELGVWMNTAKDQLLYKIELHLPQNYGVSSYLVNGSVKLGFVGENGVLWTSAPRTIKASDCSPSQTLSSGGYMVITGTVKPTDKDQTFAVNAPLPFTTRPNKLKIRAMVNYTATGQTLDVAPLVAEVSYLPEVTIDPDTVTDANQITTIETDDPRVNKYKDDWKVRSSGNTLGLVNSIRSVGQAPSGNPPQDADAQTGGKITDFSFYMPQPGGFAASVGELGYVHTGLEGSAKKGVPWRTFRLQKSTSSSVLPDWALMDLFTVPSEIPAASALQVLAPNGNSVGGRVNVNAQIRPASLKNAKRLNPLAAVFYNVKKADGSTISLATANTIADNIRGHAGNFFPKYDAADPDFPITLYDSPGEVIEVNGVADSGESGEEVVRQVANQLTARGGVFSVYSIGQALKQTNDGKLIVLAEQRLQSFIERLWDASGNVRTRTIYDRRLTP